MSVLTHCCGIHNGRVSHPGALKKLAERTFSAETLLRDEQLPRCMCRYVTDGAMRESARADGVRDPELVNDIDVQRAARLRLYSPGAHCCCVSPKDSEDQVQSGSMATTWIISALLVCSLSCSSLLNTLH